MRSEQKWMVFNIIFLILLAVGIGVFLKFVRGASTLTTLLYTGFFCVIFLAPVLPHILQAFKTESSTSSKTLSEIVGEMKRSFFQPKRVVSFLVLFFSVPMLASVSVYLALQHLGYFPTWLPLVWLLIFVVGIALIFRPQKYM